jgi:hypothetical protein
VIELTEDSGLPDGQEVSVVLRPVEEAHARGEGLKRAFGGWAENRRTSYGSICMGFVSMSQGDKDKPTERLSLHGMTPEEALKKALGTPPPPKRDDNEADEGDDQR